ncbi:MAG: NUDIX domain-containing protein [Nitrospina sp.]|nr:NUDIX domain-containing protein [Nitrospina sp.]
MSVENEIYNVVDQNDRVVGTASRKHIHENKLLHRSIHIFVFNSRKELFLQKRALCKDENPGLWDTSSAGHVDAGETYDVCAHRELWEELGLTANLKTSIKIPACQKTYWEHVQAYSCISDAEIRINPAEISEGAFFSLSHIRKEMSLNPTQFTSSFKMLFDRIRNIKNISLNEIELENIF